MRFIDTSEGVVLVFYLLLLISDFCSCSIHVMTGWDGMEGMSVMYDCSMHNVHM